MLWASRRASITSTFSFASKTYGDRTVHTCQAPKGKLLVYNRTFRSAAADSALSAMADEFLGTREIAGLAVVGGAVVQAGWHANSRDQLSW
jgi:hypothetical protein